MFKLYPKIILGLLFLSISSVLFSQNVGINTSGTTPSANAILDLNTGNSRNEGLIIPTVTLNSSLTAFGPSTSGPMAGNPNASGHDNGMMIYNGTTANGNAIGYYYWNNTTSTWVSVSGGTGNVSTSCTATLNYIPVFTASNTLCNSDINQVTSTYTAVGVSTASPVNMLDVNGSMAIGAGTNTAGAHYASGTAAPSDGMIIEGQVGMGISTSTLPATSALDVYSTSQGFLLPGMSSAPATPVNGLIFYNTTTDCLEYYAAATASWVDIACPCVPPSAPASVSGSTSPVISTAYTYTCATVTGATSYTWSVSNATYATITATSANSCTVTTTGTAGSFSVCVTANDPCSSSQTCLAVTSTTCSGVITQDPNASSSAASGQNVKTLTITTSDANDLVLVDVASFDNNTTVNAGTVTYAGAGSGTATNYEITATGDKYAPTEIYWFVAATAGTYTITVTEPTSYDNGYYLNFAVALTGFCSTPSSSDLVADEIDNYTSGTCVASITNTGQALVAGSYLFVAGTAYWCSGSTKAQTFTSTSGTITLLQSTNVTSGCDGAIGGAAISTAGTWTVVYGDDRDIEYGSQISIEIH